MGKRTLEDLFNEDLFNSSLYKTLTKYQHVARLSTDDTEGLLNGEIIVMPKIDGANMTIAWTEEDGHIIASRNSVKSVGGKPAVGFRGAVQYMLNHPGLMELSKQFIIRGEWLVKHTILYPSEIMNNFYVFDIQRYKDNSYVHPDEYIPLLIKHDIKYIPVLTRLTNPTPEELTKLVKGPSEFQELSGQKEGIVIKRYDFVNRYGRTQWGKIVDKDFRQKNKIAFNAPGKNVEIEVAFAATYVTQNLVLKTIEKIKTENDGEVNIKMMGQIIDRVWYDLFHEELWTFVKKRRVAEFNFRKARSICNDAIRDIALAYFNKTLMMDDYNDKS